MNFVVSLVLSTLETVMIFTLMFAVFRFLIKEYISSMFIVGGLLAFVSFSMRNVFDLAAFDPIVQLVLLTFFMRYLFKVQWFYSGVMSVTGYVFYAAIQSVIMIVLGQLGLYSLEDAQTGANSGAYLLQVVTIIVAFGVYWFLKKINFGFTFVPYGPRANVKIQGFNRQILYLLISVIASFTLSVYSMVSDILWLFVLASIILIGVFVFLIYISNRKEYEDEAEEY